MDYFLSASLADITLPEELPRELFSSSSSSEEELPREPLKDLVMLPVTRNKFLNHKRLMMSYHSNISLDECAKWIITLSSKTISPIISFSWTRRWGMTYIFVTWSAPFRGRARDLEWQGETPTLRRVWNRGQADRVEDFMNGH